MALALTSYLYGVEDQFFGRLFGAFFVFFWLLAVTFLAAVPFVGWAATHWFGPTWTKNTPAAARRKPTPAKAVARKSPRAATQLNSTNHHP